MDFSAGRYRNGAHGQTESKVNLLGLFSILTTMVSVALRGIEEVVFSP
ncbi:hypothetical protein [Nitrosomonas communis]|uniref:Uncharacterized protein n=1 Tax=Nitrosomonas communis TaxID=44574 RepID=A0A1I4WIN2_9PROT|nr:hypothetical protein [Nitrosomonas communis]SFN13082.1 hypothetical protein SAMN05421863_110911 [Nitrosomonas communis]